MIVATVVGTRPQLVKAAAVSRAFSTRDDITERLVNTGQHYDEELSASLFRELEIPAPAIDLGVGSGPHGAQTGAMLAGLEDAFERLSPDVVLVYGDTNSTLAAALAASKMLVTLVHVEAGMRSYDRRMPEEVNRVVSDVLADVLLCPSGTAVDNLAAEGITRGVHEVGDVMLDSLRWQLRAPLEPPADLPDRFALLTLHRAENTTPRAVRAVLRAARRLAADGLPVLAPLHPRTRAVLADDRDHPGVTVLPPISHREVLSLASAATVVLTDSGGLQREAYWLGTPCVTLRDRTEWVETVATGWNRLAGVDDDEIVAAVYRPWPTTERPSLYGDGDAASRVVEIIATCI